MPMKKLWDYAIEMKERLYQGRGRYICCQGRREERCESLSKKQLKKEYIRPSKPPQTALVFFVEKKDGKKHMV